MELKDVQSFSTNSISVILRSTPAFGDIVAFEITARGTVTAPKQAGEIELLTGTLSHGTKSYSKEDIDRIFTESGAAFGIEARSDYLEVSIKCLKKFLPTLLPVLSEMLREPLLKPEEIEISRSQLMSHLKSETDHPDHLLQLALSKAYYADHPYSMRPSGYVETVPNITREDLFALLPKLFNKQNLLFTVIGDLTKDRAEELIQKYFSLLPEGERSPVVTTPPTNPVTLVFEKKESPTTYFMAKFKTPSLMNPDYPPLVLATEILNHRLFEEVRTKRGLTYSVSAGIGNSAVNSGHFYVTSTQLPEAIKVIFDEVKKMQTEKIDEKTLELQIRKFTSNWYLGREQASSQASILALYEMIGNGWQAADTFIHRLEKVTPDDVIRVSKEYFRNFTFGLVGPEKLQISTLSELMPLAKPTSAAPKSKASSKPAKATPAKH